MSQTGFTPILIYGSGTATNVPLAANLTSNTSGAELAINYADGKLFYKDSSGFVQVLATKGAAQNSISFGTTGLTPSTATQGVVTVAGTLITSNGGTGLSSYTAGDLPYYASGTALSKLAIGTAGQVLTVNSGATAPQWTSASLIVGGAAGSNTQIQYNNSGALGASSAFTWSGTTVATPSLTTSTATTGSTNKGPLNYGTLSFSDTGIVQSAQTSVNSYFQNVMQNTSAGTAASAEFIAYNDQGTASTNYATVGINSSGYSGTGSINAPGYGYFLTASTDLVLGTIGANGIHFTTNSSASDALAISSTGVISIPSSGTSNGVAYLNGSKQLTTGTALTFDGTSLKIGTTGATNYRLLLSRGGTAGELAQFTDGVAQSLTFSTGSGVINTDSPNGGALAWQISSSEQMRLTSKALMVGYTSDSGFSGTYNLGVAGSVGIGTSSPSARITVAAANTVVASRGTAYLYSTDSMAINLGGQLSLGGSYTGTAETIFGAVAGRKETGTAGDINGYLQFSVTNSSLGVVERARIDSSGNLGLGVTPSAWFANSKVMQLGSGGSVEARSNYAPYVSLAANAYINSAGNDIYLNSAAATKFVQDGGVFRWNIAASGTANSTTIVTGNQYTIVAAGGNYTSFGAANNNVGTVFTATSSGTASGGAATQSIVFTQAMTLDASGNLQLGITNNPDSARLRIYGISEIDGNGVGLLKFKSSGTVIGSAGQGNYVVSGGPADGYGIQSATSLVFGSGGTTERARINSSGNLLVGTTSPTYSTDKVSIQPTSSNGTGIGIAVGNFNTFGIGIYNGYTATGTATALQFQDHNSVVRGSITVTTTGTLYNITSDHRLKTVIGPVSDAGQRIDALQPIDYTWNNTGERTRGFLAHKFQEVYAGSVTGSKDAVDADGNPVYQQMQPSTPEVIADLVAEIQSLRKRLAALESK